MIRYTKEILPHKNQCSEYAGKPMKIYLDNIQTL
jgi:hypothetical protein